MIPLAHGHLLVRPLSQGNRPGSRYIPVFRLKIMCQQSIVVQHARLDYWKVSRTNNQPGCRVSTQLDTPGYGFVFLYRTSVQCASGVVCFDLITLLLRPLFFSWQMPHFCAQICPSPSPVAAPGGSRHGLVQSSLRSACIVMHAADAFNLGTGRVGAWSWRLLSDFLSFSRAWDYLRLLKLRAPKYPT